MKFVRQYPTYVFTEDSGLDRFVIPDFACKARKLIIELDGSIHDLDEVYQLDTVKQELLTQQ
jgi:very-short-patch-repair endonuclease